MRIRNNKEFNIKVQAQYSGAGASAPGYITIPAGATLELTDAEWKPFVAPAKIDLECGNLEITKAPALSDEEVEEAPAKEAPVAKAPAKEAPKK